MARQRLLLPRSAASVISCSVTSTIDHSSTSEYRRDERLGSGELPVVAIAYPPNQLIESLLDAIESSLDLTELGRCRGCGETAGKHLSWVLRERCDQRPVLEDVGPSSG
jgi:hypothetical protein